MVCREYYATLNGISVKKIELAERIKGLGGYECFPDVRCELVTPMGNMIKITGGRCSKTKLRIMLAESTEQIQEEASALVKKISGLKLVG